MKKEVKKDDMARDRLVRFVFGMAVMAALFSGVLIAIHMFGLMEYTVSETVTPPVIESFRAEPEAIRAGESSTLIWNVTRAWNVSIDKVGPVASSGEFVVLPEETSIYTLSAANHAGEAEATITVQVVAKVPEIEEMADSAAISSKSEPENVII